MQICEYGLNMDENFWLRPRAQSYGPSRRRMRPIVHLIACRSAVVDVVLEFSLCPAGRDAPRNRSSVHRTHAHTHAVIICAVCHVGPQFVTQCVVSIRMHVATETSEFGIQQCISKYCHCTISECVREQHFVFSCHANSSKLEKINLSRRSETGIIC